MNFFQIIYILFFDKKKYYINKIKNKIMKIKQLKKII